MKPLKTKFSLVVLSLFMGVTAQSCSVRAQQPITVIALAKIKPGKEIEFKKAVLDILEPTRKEKGVIQFLFHQSTSSTQEFAFYEQWERQEDLNTHLKSVHMQRFFKKAGDSFEPGFPSIRTYLRLEK